MLQGEPKVHQESSGTHAPPHGDTHEMKLAGGQFYGRTLASKETGGFRVTENYYAPRQILPAHAHECAYLSVLLGGSYTENCDNRTWHHTPRNTVFHRAGEVHSHRFHQAGGRFLIIEFSPAWVERLDGCGLQISHHTVFDGRHIVELGLRLTRELRTWGRTSELAIEGLVLEILAQISPRTEDGGTPKRAGWLDRVVEILDRDFASPLSLRALGSTVAVHPVHLAREFRKRFHCTIGEYVRGLRIAYVRHELIATNDSIASIALRAGFSDHSHLTRLFRAHTGLSPSSFRNLRVLG